MELEFVGLSGTPLYDDGSFFPLISGAAAVCLVNCFFGMAFMVLRGIEQLILFDSIADGIADADDDGGSGSGGTVFCCSIVDVDDDFLLICDVFLIKEEDIEEGEDGFTLRFFSFRTARPFLTVYISTSEEIKQEEKHKKQERED